MSNMFAKQQDPSPASNESNLSDPPALPAVPAPPPALARSGLGEKLQLALTEAGMSSPAEVRALKRILNKGKLREEQAAALVSFARDEGEPALAIVKFAAKHSLAVPEVKDLVQTAKELGSRDWFMVKKAKDHLTKVSGLDAWTDAPRETRAEVIEEVSELAEHWKRMNDHEPEISMASYEALFNVRRNADEVMEIVELVLETELSDRETRRNYPYLTRIHIIIDGLEDDPTADLRTIRSWFRGQGQCLGEEDLDELYWGDEPEPDLREIERMQALERPRMVNRRRYYE